MAERLRDIGFAVLLVDYLAGEGVQNACSGEIALETIADYIAESVAFARTRSFVDANRIHIIGWSMGGRGLLEWIQTRTAGTLAADSVVAVYAGCAAAAPWDVSLPVLMLLGGADDIAPPDVCQRLARALPDDHQVTVRVYPNGRHGFDIEGAPPIVDAGGGFTLGYNAEAADGAWREIRSFLGSPR